jgi:ABC-type microcin C transport system duplicated ATPase subunit YejF
MTLARALYSNASVLLLDDVLAALDVHTAKYIAREALRGDLVEGRTVLLVTHNIALTANIAGYIVVLGRSGRVAEHGTVEEVLKMDVKLRRQVEDKEDGDGGCDAAPTNDGKGKLVIPEEKAIGRVEFAAFALFLRAIGSPFVWAGFTTFFWSATLFDVGKTWYIGYWSSQYEGRLPSEVNSAK